MKIKGKSKEVFIIVRNYSFPQGGVTHINSADGYYIDKAKAEARAEEINTNWSVGKRYYVESLFLNED